MNIPNPFHPPFLLVLLTSLLAFAQIGCRDRDTTSVPGGDPAPLTTAEPTGQEGGGWFARITGFQKTLASKSAQVAAAEAAARQAEREVLAMRVLLDSQRDATDQARKGQSFWRVTASVLCALAVLAVFLGAAVGSYARQHRQVSRHSSPSTPDSDELATLA